MSDNEIKQILIERKRQQRKLERREELRGYVEGFIGMGGIVLLILMLSVIGG